MQSTEGDKMITLRRSNERGKTKLNSLDRRHTFSFGDYYDPQHMVFRELRVINEGRVNPGAGFPMQLASRHGDHHVRYGRRRVEERLLMQHTVTQILAEAATVKEATPHPF